MATNPIGLALVALSAGAVLVYQNWKPISGFFKGLWAGITEVGAKAWTWLKDAFLSWSPLGLVIKNWKPISGFFGDMWAIVKDSALIAWDWLKNEFLSWAPVQMVRENWGPVSESLGGVWASVKAGAGATWSWLKGALSWTPLGLIVKNWEPIRSFFGGLWKGLVGSAKGFLDWIIGKISGIGDAVHKLRTFMDGKAEAVSGSSPPARRKPPTFPPMATARHAGAAGVNDNSKTEINIHQQSGQDAKAVADEVERRLDKRRRARGGGQLYDAPRGY